MTIKFNESLYKSKKSTIITFYCSVIIMLLITSYGFYFSADKFLKNNRIIIGDILVETDFPIKNSIKLVTYLMIFSLIAWFSAIKIYEDKLRNLSSSVQTLIQIFSIILAIVAIYELVYNFIVWNSLITTSLIEGTFNPKSEEIDYPVPETPWNMFFATNMLLAALIITAHFFYTMTKLKSII